ncbi:hypothetical protein EB118_09810 [bacterium]|nr:hypothetical protein [bacterium]
MNQNSNEKLKPDIKSLLPITILPDKSLVYENFRILKNRNEDYELRHLKGRNLIDKFRTKTAALLAAKFYKTKDFNRYNQVVNLDSKYYHNLTDAQLYKFKVKNTQDHDKKDTLQWRLEVSEQRVSYYKEQISQLFKTYF